MKPGAQFLACAPPGSVVRANLGIRVAGEMPADGLATRWLGEAGEIRMFKHWAIGLRSGLLPEGCVATPEVAQKKVPSGAKFSQGF